MNPPFASPAVSSSFLSSFSDSPVVSFATSRIGLPSLYVKTKDTHNFPDQQPRKTGQSKYPFESKPALAGLLV
jgi:hypothetical protein